MTLRFGRARAVFFGVGSFAVPALRALAGEKSEEDGEGVGVGGVGGVGVEVGLVVTSPPRPSGRKMILRDCPVAGEAKRLGLPLAEVESPGDATAKIRETGARVFVVCDYGRLLPRGLLRLPRDGGLNIHASLLPRWRGASPVRSAILAGDEKTGVTIMKMDTGLDTGAILLSRETAIGVDETGGALSGRLAEMGAELIVEALGDLRNLEELPQLGEATYAGKLGSDARWLDFDGSAVAERRRILAFAPSPGARLMLRDAEIKALAGEVATDIPAGAGGVGGAGTVLRADESGLWIVCGEGVLRLTRLQRSGGREMSAGEFLRGFPVKTGELATRR